MYAPLLPAGMNAQQAHEVYNECYRAGLLSVKSPGASGEMTFSIAPGMKSALESILFGGE